MEPYRPFVDQLVYNLTSNNDLNDDIPTQVKQELLNIPTLTIAHRGKSSSLMIMVGKTASSLVRYYAGEVDTIEYPTL